MNGKKLNEAIPQPGWIVWHDAEQVRQQPAVRQRQHYKCVKVKRVIVSCASMSTL